MSSITFRAIVNDDQVIRPPGGVLLPAGELEVTVRPVGAGTGSTPATRQAANLRLQRHRVSLGHATGIENEAIDADLARAYGAGLNTP